MSPDPHILRAYRAYRRAHPDTAGRYALAIVRGAAAFNVLDFDDYDPRSGVSWAQLEHDGLTFRVCVEFDQDAYREYSEPRSAPDSDIETCPQWWVCVETRDGAGRWQHVDSCGGIGGGTWDGRGEPDLDDETRATLWQEFILPAVEMSAEQDRARWARQLETVGSE